MTSPVLTFAAWMARLLPMQAKLVLYRYKPLAGVIREGLNRAAPHGLVHVTIAAGGLAGYRMALDLQREKDYWLGTYETELEEAINGLVQPGMVVFDVGANIGYISLLLDSKVGEAGRVFAFEALPENVERLRANLELNGIHNVVVTQAAVIDGERQVRFLVGPSSGMGKAEGSAGRQEISYENAISVDGISLDGFVYSRGHPQPAVVKMDIEGGEILALPGMQRLLSEARPLMLVELHGPEAARVVWERFTQTGYRICQMSPGYPQVTSLGSLGWKAYLVAYPPTA
jgi:FkbM family methyltransferase